MLRENGVGFYQFHTGNLSNEHLLAWGWFEFNDNIVADNYMGMFLWNAPNGQTTLRGSLKFANNTAMNISFMRSPFGSIEGGAYDNWTEIDWECSKADGGTGDEPRILRLGAEAKPFLLRRGVEIKNGDVFFPGQPRIMPGCHFDLENANWTYYPEDDCEWCKDAAFVGAGKGLLRGDCACRTWGEDDLKCAYDREGSESFPHCDTAAHRWQIICCEGSGCDEEISPHQCDCGGGKMVATYYPCESYNACKDDFDNELQNIPRCADELVEME